MEFQEFQKIPRLSRECVITEKIDGTNGVIYVGETGEFLTGSRSRWITPEMDNHGFSRWAHDNKEALLKLGPGFHYGEWWGSGIQRGYGLLKGEKHFSLFNVGRWVKFNGNPVLKEKQEYCPDCCDVVPILWQGMFDTSSIILAMSDLILNGSKASPGFMKPEGVVIYHLQGRLFFKKTIEKDDEYKTNSRQRQEG